MREEQHRFMMLAGKLPARLTVEQTAWLVNCQAHDIPVLVAARLLRPLGNPPPNGVKFFCTADVLEVCKDRSWLSKVSAAIYQHWHRQNVRKRRQAEAAASNGEAATTELPVAAAA